MNDPQSLIAQFVAESIRVKSEFFQAQASLVAETSRKIADALRKRQKILLFGNGERLRIQHRVLSPD